MAGFLPVGSLQNYDGKNFQLKKKPTGCPRFDPLFGCCPWTGTSNEVEACPVQVSFCISLIIVDKSKEKKAPHDPDRLVCWSLCFFLRIPTDGLVFPDKSTKNLLTIAPIWFDETQQFD